MARHARLIHWLSFLPYYLTEAVVRIVVYSLVGRRAEARGILLGVWDSALGRLGPGRLEQFLECSPGESG